MYRGRSSIIKKQHTAKYLNENLPCSYTHRICTQNRLDNYEYCLKHILEDKNAPYKQCNYVSNKNGRRCMNAAPKADKKDGLCVEHYKKAASFRQRNQKKQHVYETPETLLEAIEEHAKGDGPSRFPADNSQQKCASSGESDSGPPLVDQAWRGDAESDAESVDSDQEDSLKKAGVYTAEEAALVTRDKLIRLQSLYIDQFKRLQHELKEKRRKFLHQKRMEMDTLGGLQSYKDSPEYQDQYKMLQAMKRYHQRHGKEALLHRQSKRRRMAASEGVNYRPVTTNRCISVTKGAKCNGPALPFSKYCQEHIMQDGHQVLYKPCIHGDGACGIPSPAIIALAMCPVHAQLLFLEGVSKTRHEQIDAEQEHHIDVVSEDAIPQP